MKKIFKLFLLLIIIFLGVTDLQGWTFNLKNGLVAYFSFDNCDARDDSGNGYDGRIYGNPQCVEGVNGKAFKFDGIDDFIVVPNSKDLNSNIQEAKTITLWFKSPASFKVKNRQVIYKEGSFLRGLNIYFFNGRIYAGGWNRPIRESHWLGTFLKTNKIEPQKWYFLALVLEPKSSEKANNFKLYLNGKLVDEGKGATLYPHFGPVSFASNFGGTSFHDEMYFLRQLVLRRHKRFKLHKRLFRPVYVFQGTLDEIRIYNRALSEKEIKTLYKKRFYKIAQHIENKTITNKTVSLNKNTEFTSEKTLNKKKFCQKCVKSFPNRYLFITVVYDYDELSDLPYVKNDINLIKTLGKCYLGVPEENIKVLENPSVGKLKKELRKFVKKIYSKDAVLYFYYSGHGIVDSKGNFYLLPSDASIEDEQTLKETAISLDTLRACLEMAKGYKVAFIDACRVNPPWKPAVLLYKPKMSNIALIFSTQQGQISNMDKEHKHSAFTRALFELACAGVENIDLDASGYVEIKEIEKPLKNWLKRVSVSPEQTPDVWGPTDIPLFPITVPFKP